MCSYFFMSPSPFPSPSVKTATHSQAVGLGHLIKRAMPGLVQWFLRSSGSLLQELELRDGVQVGWELSCEQSIRVNMSRNGSFHGILRLLWVLFLLRPAFQFSLDSNSRSFAFLLNEKANLVGTAPGNPTVYLWDRRIHSHTKR